MRDYKETSAILRGLSVSLQAIDHDYAQLCDDAADVIEELDVIVEGYRSRMRLGSQWISVEDRLPEHYNPVLVTYIGFNSNSLLSDMVAYRDGDGDWCWWDGNFPSGEMCKVKITHWMPLPEAPKGVE